VRSDPPPLRRESDLGAFPAAELRQQVTATGHNQARTTIYRQRSAFQRELAQQPPVITRGRVRDVLSTHDGHVARRFWMVDEFWRIRGRIPEHHRSRYDLEQRVLVPGGKDAQTCRCVGAHPAKDFRRQIICQIFLKREKARQYGNHVAPPSDRASDITNERLGPGQAPVLTHDGSTNSGCKLPQPST
jgi:hypothetical protein